MSTVFNGSMLFSGSHFRLVAGGVFSVLLVAACVTDVRWRRIPNALVLALVIPGIAYSVSLDPWLPGLGRAMGGLTLGFTIWIAFFVIGAIGAGDVKLFAAAGAWLGPGATWRAAVVSAAIGGVLAVAMLLRERRAREGFEKVLISVSTRSVAPLTPDPAMPTSRQLPYGVALACGALIVAWIPGVLA
jgi:prepilin peptidase CpaA